MKKMVYDEAEIKRFTAPMEEPMRHQIQDAMNLKIPKEYIQVLVNKKFNFYSRAYLIGCILDQESLEGIQQLAKKESAEEMCLDEYSGRFYTPIPEIGNRCSDVKETALPF